MPNAHHGAHSAPRNAGDVPYHGGSEPNAPYEVLQVRGATSSPDAQPTGPSEPDTTGASDSAGECSDDSDQARPTLAAQQQQDAEIGWLVRLRLSQAQPPGIQDLASDSEAAKELAAQLDQLEVHDGLVYRRWARQDDKNDVLQLLVQLRLVKTSSNAPMQG